MPVIDYIAARQLLDNAFAEAESALLADSPPPVADDIAAACARVFNSSTQAYREALLGCIAARIQDDSTNIRLPYVKHGPGAFNARTLDDKVVHPFLHGNRIPASKSNPYLNVFRRGVQFVESARENQKDPGGYDAFLSLLNHITTLDDGEIRQLLRYVLYKFADLREAARIPLARLHRISLGQYDRLLTGLLATASGGRFPVLVVVAAFMTVKEFFGLSWQIDRQGINVADAASQAAGDITIRDGDRVLFAAEVTEQRVNTSRIETTFLAKIAPAGIEDYLFFVRPSGVTDEAAQQAERYFAQGHEVNFLEVKNWVLMLLGLTGRRGRDIFNQRMLELLDDSDIPASMKVAWNEQLAHLTSVPSRASAV